MWISWYHNVKPSWTLLQHQMRELAVKQGMLKHANSTQITAISILMLSYLTGRTPVLSPTNSTKALMYAKYKTS